MKYSEAIDLLIMGHAVRNTDWKSSTVCIKIEKSEFESREDRFVKVFNKNHYIFKWSPYITDLTSNNWEMADDAFKTLKKDKEERKKKIEELEKEELEKNDQERFEQDYNNFKPSFYHRIWNKIKSIIKSH